MKVYGEISNAQLENRSSAYSAGVVGRLWWRTDLTQAQLDDGTNIRALLRNDGFCVFGNNGTANNNIRFHRGASGVLQFVTGGDVTAEGTLSTSLNQISGRLENYTTVGRPSFGNAGRVYWDTTLVNLVVDTGSAWAPLPSNGTTNRLNAEWDIVIGSAAQVTSGAATHSTWVTAAAAAVAGNTILVLEGTWAESPTFSVQVRIEGAGYGSYLNGALTFATSSDRSTVKGIRTSNDVTINSGVTMVYMEDIRFATGKSFVDNSGGITNKLAGFQET